MEHQRIVEFEEKCIQEQPPACTTACPVHVDVRSFMAKIKAGLFDEAWKIYRKAVSFPGIMARICDHPCQAACKRGEAGDAVSIAALERACAVINAVPPASMAVPPKKDSRVAVVGGGLSGLSAALELAVKGYGVVVFEALDLLGGSLWEIPAEVLPRQVIMEETAVLGALGVQTRLGAALGKEYSLVDLCREFDAIYLATGKNYRGAFGSIDPVTFAGGQEKVFAGGSLRREGGYSPVGSLSDGRRAAISIDRYLQNVSLTAVRENEGPYQTRLFTSTEGIEPLPAVVPASPGEGYTREEACREAGRCLQCQCLECVKVCEYLSHFKSYPKQYVRQINHNLKMVMGHHTANKLINSCSLCGLCKEVCPNGLDMGDLCRQARNEMFSKEKMPPSAHDFPIRDMEFSNSEVCALTRHQPGHGSSSHIFFPGCQLSASAPDQVEKAYDYLTGRVAGGVGLMLRCCGAPAEWSGRADLFQEGLREIAGQLREMGSPRLILACSTCYRMFKNYLPEIEIVSLWEIYDQYGLPGEAAIRIAGPVAVQDPCTARQEKHIQDSVRSILLKLGLENEELPAGRDKTECCGYGGLMLFANRDLADRAIRRRIGESPADYVAYCAMCRDNFAARGKKTYHLLDLIYGRDGDDLKGPGYSQRQENRARLKNKMLKAVWGDMVEVPKSSHEAIKLVIPAAVGEIMENRLILLEDVQRVIEYAEKTGNKLLNRNSGHILACHRPVSVTYWVEYTPQEDGFVVHNAYSHRMAVEGNN